MKSIVVVGSINMDIVNRVSEFPKPGETVHGEGIHYGCGGKGANQAVAAAKAGGKVMMAGAVGQDAFAGQLISSLASNQVNTEQIVSLSGNSGTALITVDRHGENQIILSSEANSRLSKETLPFLPQLLSQAGSVILQNEIPWETNLYVMETAAKLGVKVYFNLAPAFALPESAYAWIDTLIVNQTEAEVLTGVQVRETGQEERAVDLILQRGIRNVILTKGSSGSLYKNSRGQRYETPAFQVKPADTTAAGDTFIGFFVSLAQSGQSISHSLYLASAAAAICVTHPGAQDSIPDIAEIQRFLKNLQIRHD